MNVHDLCKDSSAESIESYFRVLQSEGATDDLSYVVDLRNELRYTPLHTAIFARYAFLPMSTRYFLSSLKLLEFAPFFVSMYLRNIDAVRTLIKFGADGDLKCHGTPPIHLVLATSILPDGLEFSKACLSVLLQNNVNPLAKV
jgi:hypothetical protein